MGPALVDINQLTIDPRLQPRVDGLDDAHVRELEEVADELPPISVVRKDGAYVVIDGHHTIAARSNAGHSAVMVQVIDPPEDGDLYKAAFGCNLRHGKPLTLADRRAFAEYLLRLRPQSSNLEVSRASALSPTTVASIRDRLEAEDTIERVQERQTRSGQTFSVPTTYRQPGELPPENVVEALGQALSPLDRRRQRQIASYFQRLAVALEAQHDLRGFDTLGKAADAVRLVIGAEGARELAKRLGPAAFNTLEVSRLLGYDPEADE